MKVLDDFYEPEAAERNTKTLINDTKVFALFGYVGTPTSLAALKQANPAGVPFFAPYSGAMAPEYGAKKGTPAGLACLRAARLVGVPT
ncbi:hypothetical protein [Ralstonia solanacearum]|uniref:hypothetical protein n=1 Tax=Ralstonia solanacearum TaxID=305 RepID=UPI00399D72F6